MGVNEILMTAGAVRNALGRSYDTFCRSFDAIGRERAKTASVGRRLFPGIRGCAVCDESGHGLRVEVAHIHALEECGLTASDNLILLCRRLGKRHDERGCHQLFDDGFASRVEVTALRTAAGRGLTCTLRQQMQERYREHCAPRATSKLDRFEALLASIHGEKTRGALRKAQHLAENAATRWPAGSEEHFVLKLKAVEMMRRRAARGSLDDAARHFEQLLQGPIPEARRSSFFYEGGYVELLRGRHVKALPYFIKSRDAIDPAESGWKWAAAASLVAQCEVAVGGGNAHWSQALRLVNEAERASTASGGTDGARWVMNSRVNRARILLAKGDIEAAVRAWEAAMETWEGMTALTGWDHGSRTVIVGFAGVLSARAAGSEKDAKTALRYLARASVGFLGAGRQHPETVRDVLLSATQALTLLGRKELAARFRETAERTRDGSSWLHPYRADC